MTPPEQIKLERRNALIDVFETLAVRWPKVFGPEKVKSMEPVWQRALLNVATDMLKPAALEFAATHEGTWPEPPVFARFAREYERTHTAQPEQDGGRMFWFKKPGEERLSFARKLPDGAYVGIAQHERESVIQGTRDGTIPWGWL